MGHTPVGKLKLSKDKKGLCMSVVTAEIAANVGKVECYQSSEEMKKALEQMRSTASVPSTVHKISTERLMHWIDTTMCECPPALIVREKGLENQ